MKFSQISKKKIDHHSRNRDLLIKTNEEKNSKKGISINKLSLITSLPSSRIEQQLKNEFMFPKFSLELINNNKNIPSIKSDLYLKNQCQTQNVAIIECQQFSYNKSLEKSHSCPLPINANHSDIDYNYIQSAHIINQHLYENKNEIETDQSTENISSDENNANHRLLQYHENIKKNYFPHRSNVLDICKKIMSILNSLWRKPLRRIGSREFLLEYEQILPTNNNRANFKQEHPINSHIGLALLALLVFPPIGIFAFILSVWSLCHQQDRQLSEKFGNAVYWLSIFSICLSFFLVFIFFHLLYISVFNKSIFN